MGSQDEYRVAFANLQLRVKRKPDGWVVDIKDLAERETLFESAAATIVDAKTAAVEFAFIRLFGTDHSKDSKETAEALMWEAV